MEEGGPKSRLGDLGDEVAERLTIHELVDVADGAEGI